MKLKNKLLNLLKIDYPIIQGPMAGSSPPALVAAVCNAGGLGSLGAALMPPDQIRTAIKEIRELTSKPFAVNLFAPEKIPTPSNESIARANKVLDPFRRQLGIPESPEFKPPQISFNEQLTVLLEEKIPIFSFTFGILSADIIQKIKKHNIIVIGTATTTKEAKLLEKSGVDVVVAQGSEAGGHRGSDPQTSIEGALIGGMALVPQIVDQIKIPVIASGGIMNGRGVVAALALGASAAQMGTAFLACPESGIHPQWRQKLLNSTDESTRITSAFTGRYARGIKNTFISEMINHRDDILPYPLQRALIRDIILAASKQNNPELMTLWSGQAASLCRSKPAAILMSELVEEMNQIINNFCHLQ